MSISFYAVITSVLLFSVPIREPLNISLLLIVAGMAISLFDKKSNIKTIFFNSLIFSFILEIITLIVFLMFDSIYYEDFFKSRYFYLHFFEAIIYISFFVLVTFSGGMFGLLAKKIIDKFIKKTKTKD